MTNYEMALDVPRFEDDKLASSSLILADLIEKVPTKSIGTGQFVIGTSKVRPRLSETFTPRREDGHLRAALQFRAGSRRPRSRTARSSTRS